MEILHLAQLLRFTALHSILDQLHTMDSLPDELQMPANIIPRLAAKMTCQKKKQARLCFDHCTINTYLIRRIFEQVKAECSTHIERLLNKPAVPAEITAFIQRLQMLHSLWTPPELYRTSFDVMPEDKRYDQVQSGCEACILSLIGGKGEILCDLRASILGRKKTDKKPGSLLHLVEAWIGLQEHSEQFLKGSRKLGRIILGCRKRWQMERRGEEPRMKRRRKHQRFSGKEAVVQPPILGQAAFPVQAAMVVGESAAPQRRNYAAVARPDRWKPLPHPPLPTAIAEDHGVVQHLDDDDISQASQEYYEIPIGHEVPDRYDRLHSIIDTYDRRDSTAAANSARTLQPDIYRQPPRPPKAPFAQSLAPRSSSRTYSPSSPTAQQYDYTFQIPSSSHRPRHPPTTNRRRLSSMETPPPEDPENPRYHPLADMFMHGNWRTEGAAVEGSPVYSVRSEEVSVQSDGEVEVYEEWEENWAEQGIRDEAQERVGPRIKVRMEEDADAINDEEDVMSTMSRSPMTRDERLTRWSGLQAQWR